MAYDPEACGAKCSVCPLREMREGDPVAPEFNGGARILIIGETPEVDAVKTGVPFSGEGGKMLQRMMSQSGLTRGHAHWTHTLACRPASKMETMTSKIQAHNREVKKRNAPIIEQNKQRKKLGMDPLPLEEPWPTPEACCRPRLVHDMRQARATNVMLVGNLAVKAMLGNQKVQDVRGGVREVWEADTPDGDVTHWDILVGDRETAVPPVPEARRLKVMPLLSPGFVLHKPRWTKFLAGDVARAARFFQGMEDWTPPKVTYHPKPAEFRAFLARPEPFFSCDLETDGIEPLTARTRCIGVGTADGKEVMIAGILSKDGHGRFYNPADLRKILEIWKEFCENENILKVGHNFGGYDRTVIQSDLKHDVKPTMDTMLLHRLVESELPHNLGFVGGVYAGVPSWKHDREGRKLATEAESDHELHAYCAIDVSACAVSAWKLIEVTKLRAQDHLVPFDHAVQEVCTEMHTIGMYVDQKRRREHEVEQMRTLVAQRRLIRDIVGSDAFNPASPVQVRDLIFEKWGLGPALDTLANPMDDKDRYNAAGDPSTNDVVLRGLTLAQGLTDQQAAFLKALRKYRKANKLLGTYILKLRYNTEEIDFDAEGYDEDEDKEEREERRKRGQSKCGIVDPYTNRMYPGYNPAVATCVTPDTWLWSDKGLVQIGEIQGYGTPGEETPAVDLRLSDGNRIATVSHLQNPGVCPTFTLETRLGVQLTGTPHHRVQTVPKRAGHLMRQNSRGQWTMCNGRPAWARLDEITVGMYVRVPCGMNHWPTEAPKLPKIRQTSMNTNAKLVVLPDTVTEDLAYFVGIYNADGSLHDSNGSFAIRISDTTGARSQEISKLARRLFGNECVRTNKEGVVITSVALEPWAAALGLNRRIENKSAPLWLRQSPERYVKAYLRGLMLDSSWGARSDGGVFWQYSGTRRLCQEVQMFLLNAGLPAGLNDARTEKSPQTWKLCASNIDAYQIGLYVGHPVPKTTKPDLKAGYVRRGNDLWLRVRSVAPSGLHPVLDVTIPETEQFWANGTVSHNTGRLSSSKPINAQNFVSDIKDIITAAPGHVLVGADADQLELRIAAALWGMDKYLQAFLENADPHSVTALMVFGEEFRTANGFVPGIWKGDLFIPDTSIAGAKWGYEAKKRRDLAKRVQYASQYMAAVETVHKVITETEDKDGNLIYAALALADVRRMHAAWLAAASQGNPGIKKGWEREIMEWRRQGYLEEPVNRRRRDFLDGENPNELVNFKVQCIPGHVRCITDAGYLPIRDLVGRKFKAWTGKGWAEATAIQKGHAALRTLRTNRGIDLPCDETHKVRVVARDKYEWRKVSDLIGGNRIALDLAQPLEFGQAVDTEDAYILGLWLADGSFSRKLGETSGDLSIAVGDKAASGGGPARSGPDQLERLSRWATSRGLSSSVRDGEGCKTFHVYRGAAEWLTSYGIDLDWKAPTKRVPDSIWQADLNARRAFLVGFLDGDGHQTPGGSVIINLCQRPLLEELWALARTVGIDGRIHGPYKADQKGHISYHLALNGSQTASRLGWGEACKLRTGPESRVPMFEIKRVVAEMDATSPKYTHKAKGRKGWTCSTESHKVIRSRLRLAAGADSEDIGVGAYVLTEMGAKGLHDHALVDSVGERGVQVPVYTLVVDDPEHSYVANGFISANSSGAALMMKSMLDVRTAIPMGIWGPHTGLITQTHDSNVLEVPIDKGEYAAAILQECMNLSHPAIPGVRITAKADVGPNWKKV